MFQHDFANFTVFCFILELIRSGCLGRRQSIDLLDDLDFDFLNGMKTDLDVADAFGDDFMFDFAPDSTGYSNQHHPANNHANSTGHNANTHAGGFANLKARTASMDSTGSFSFFENLPYDANNANSLMDELQYLNKQYADSASGVPAGGALHQGYSARHVPSNVKTESHKGSGGIQAGGAPHVSFSRYVSSIGLDPAAGHDGAQSTMSGHKGRRDSWDIAAQYIQQEEDFSRGQSSGNSRSTGSWSSTGSSQQAGPSKGAAGTNQSGPGANKPATVKKVSSIIVRKL